MNRAGRFKGLAAAMFAVMVMAVGAGAQGEIDYVLEICVQRAGTTAWLCDNKPSVPAGEAVKLRVTAKKRDGGNISTSGNLEVDYSLQSHPTARMWQRIDPSPGNALNVPRNATKTPPDPPNEPNLLTGTERAKAYTVYFTRAGDEVIGASGLLDKLVMRGTLPLTVTPGAPDKVVFNFPTPKSQLTGPPPTISGTYDVEVQVQDRFDNPVNTAVSVTVISLMPDIGDIQAPQTATTSAADGTARLTAVVTNGITGDIFDLVASITSGSKPADTASLRVGRAADRLMVFYRSGSADWNDDFDVEWDDEGEPLVQTKRQVWVKAISNATGEVAAKDGSICVISSSPSIKFFASEAAAESVTGQYLASMTGGVATFWITSDTPVDGVSLTVSAKATPDCAGDKDNAIADGARSPIAFRVSTGPVTPPPRVVSGGYVSDGGVIKSASLTFNRAASQDWFSSIEFKFGALNSTLTNIACVAVSPDDAKTVSVDFSCALAGINISETMGNNSEITINFGSEYVSELGWAPLTVNIVNGTISVLTPARVAARGRQIGIMQRGAVLQLVGLTQSTQLRVYDIRGRLLLKHTAMPNERISVKYLPRGKYLARAAGNSISFVR